ncbi:MAG TPA: SLBB domain-containing protein, partial [Phytomonospora sp.]
MRTNTTGREQVERMRRRLAQLAHPPGPPPTKPAAYPPDLPPPAEATVTVVECETAEPAPEEATTDAPLTIAALPRRILALAAVGVLVLAGLVAWWSWPRPEPVAAPAQTAASEPGPTAPLIVSVAGAVRRPGLGEVPPGSRVADAIAAAGGVADPTDLGLLNLARKVVDGELIIVGADTATGAAATGPGGGPHNRNAATAPEQRRAHPGHELADGRR